MEIFIKLPNRDLNARELTRLVASVVAVAVVTTLFFTIPSMTQFSKSVDPILFWSCYSATALLIVGIPALLLFKSCISTKRSLNDILAEEEIERPVEKREPTRLELQTQSDAQELFTYLCKKDETEYKAFIRNHKKNLRYILYESPKHSVENPSIEIHSGSLSQIIESETHQKFLSILIDEMKTEPTFKEKLSHFRAIHMCRLFRDGPKEEFFKRCEEYANDSDWIYNRNVMLPKTDLYCNATAEKQAALSFLEIVFLYDRHLEEFLQFMISSAIPARKTGTG